MQADSERQQKDKNKQIKVMQINIIQNGMRM